jgi:hypothetical protein
LFLLLIEKYDATQVFAVIWQTQAIRQQWDGMLWFPEYGLVIPAVWELLIYMHQEHIRMGVSHGLVSPEVAYNLEESGVKASGTTRLLPPRQPIGTVMSK